MCQTNNHKTVYPPYLREAAEKRPRKTLSPSSLPQGVLRREHLEGGGAAERPTQLRYVHLGAVIQAGVEALKYALRFRRNEFRLRNVQHLRMNQWTCDTITLNERCTNQSRRRAHVDYRCVISSYPGTTSTRTISYMRFPPAASKDSPLPLHR